MYLYRKTCGTVHVPVHVMYMSCMSYSSTTGYMYVCTGNQHTNWGQHYLEYCCAHGSIQIQIFRYIRVIHATNYNPINDFNSTKSSTHFLFSFSNGYLAPIAQATAMPEQKLKSCPFPGVAKLPQKYTPFLP